MQIIVIFILTFSILIDKINSDESTIDPSTVSSTVIPTDEPTTTIGYSELEESGFWRNFVWGLCVINLLWLLITVLSVCLFAEANNRTNEKQKEKKVTKTTLPPIDDYYVTTREGRDELRKLVAALAPEDMKPKEGEKNDVTVPDDKNKKKGEKVGKLSKEKLTEKQKKFIDKKMKTEEEFATDTKYKNNGAIDFRTQFTIDTDLAINEKEEEKKTKKMGKVRFDEKPIVFYEIGFGIDQYEMPMPSEKRVSSSILTASIRKMPPK